jgi:hypothetical protein
MLTLNRAGLIEMPVSGYCGRVVQPFDVVDELDVGSYVIAPRRHISGAGRHDFVEMLAKTIAHRVG